MYSGKQTARRIHNMHTKEKQNQKIASGLTGPILMGAALVSIVLGGCGKEPAEHNQDSAATTVAAVRVEKKLLYRVDKLPGEIRAYQDVAVYPKVPGFVQWIGVDRGSKVKRGQKMVVL
ncbi:MAG TPA: efflux RND transporter periplasmic adaptor subunit, partial [Chroococcales cyanobacterium]